MDWLLPIGLILGGVLAASAIIISKLPQAKEAIDRLAPIQGTIGVVLLIIAAIQFLRLSGKIDAVNSLPVIQMITIWGAITVGVLLGFLLGMPLVAKWIPGDSPAEQKAMEMQQKIVPFQGALGLAGIVFAVLWIYYTTKH